jgi:hypothetical protein
MFPAGMTPVNPAALHYPGTPMSDMSLFSDLEFQSSTPWNSSAHNSSAPVFDMVFPAMGSSSAVTPAATAPAMKRSAGPFGGTPTTSLQMMSAPNSADRSTLEVCFVSISPRVDVSV